MGLAECSYTFKNPTVGADQHVLSIGKISGILNPDPVHGTRIISVPKGSNIEMGIQSSTTSVKYIPKNIWEYARENMISILKTEKDLRSKGELQSQALMVANEVTIQIVTRKNINSFDDLLSELSEILLPFGINIKMEPLGGRQFFTFTYTVPFAQSQLKFPDGVASAIGFHGSSTKYQQNGVINEMTSLGVPKLLILRVCSTSKG